MVIEGLSLEGIRFWVKMMKVIKEDRLLKLFFRLRKVKCKVLDYGFLQKIDKGDGKTEDLDGK